METDNAKERFIAKLGLNRHAVGMAANMTSLGIPLKTTLLLLNSAEVRDLYDLSMNKKDKMDPGLDDLLERRIGSLDAKIKAEADKTGKKTKFVSVTDELLESAVDSTAALSDNQRIQILYLFNRGMGQLKNKSSNTLNKFHCIYHRKIINLLLIKNHSHNQ